MKIYRLLLQPQVSRTMTLDVQDGPVQVDVGPGKKKLRFAGEGFMVLKEKVPTVLKIEVADQS